MKRYRFWIFAGLVAGICFMLGALGSSQMPKVRALILVKIEQFSRENLPVRVLPGEVDVNFFPLGAELKSVQIVPKEEIKEILETASFESIRVSVSPWQLLRGRVRLTELTISGALIRANIPKSQKKESGPPLAGFFNLLQQVPINLIEISDSSAKLKLADPRLTIDLDNVSIRLEKLRGGALAAAIDSGSIQILEPSKKTGAETASLKIDLELIAEFARDRVELTELKVRRGDSYLNASGKATGDVESLAFQEAQFTAKSELLLESMRNWGVRAFPKELAKLPPLMGRAIVEANIRRKEGAAKPEADFVVSTTGLEIDDFFIDKLSTAGTFAKDELKLPKVTLDPPAGQILLSDLTLTTGEAKNISAKLTVPMVQLHEVLKNIGVGTIPVWVQVSGEVPCSGSIEPTFKLSCKGHARGENLLVRPSMEDKGTIVAARLFDAVGEFSIDKEKVSYAAELAMPNSKGRSSGSIGFETGFKIAYEADKLAIKDIANLADLKLEGSVRVKGVTEGTADWGTINMDLDGQDLWLEDFWLGNAKGALTFKAGQLAFNQFQGYYTVSRYSGDVKLDLHKHEIAVTGRSPFFDTRDMLKVFSRKVKLPFPVTGTGQASVKVSGPLAFNRLTYDLKSSLFRGAVAGETFDQAHFDVKSIGGEVRTERAQLTKGASTISMTGVGHPNGLIQTEIKGRGFRLEDSVIVSQSGLAVSGNLDFDMDLKGPVLAPDANLRGDLTKTSIGDQAVADSNFALMFAAKYIQGSGSLIGDVMKTNFTIPLDPAAPFSLKLSSQDWNFAPLFSAIAGPSTRKDYEGRLTSEVELSAPTGGFWNSTGTIKIDRFSLSRGSLALRSTEPLGLSMKNGQMHVDKFELSGENAFLKIVDNAHPVSKIDLQANGKLDLSLIALLTPFFEDMRGLLSFTFNVRAGKETADILGSALVEKGYLKFFDFPHPLEDISVDLLFNQKKLIFNTVKAEFGGGRISASGGMEMKGYKNYPLTVSGTFDKVTLNIPDKVKTNGSGTIAVSGNWFPFLMKANYDVKDGAWTKEFTGDDADSAGSIRRDQFLPELLLQERFVPIVLDVDINFEKGVAIKNELVDGHAMGTVNVKGNPTKPSILGKITLDKESRVYFKDTPFDVTNANIELSDPNDINPRLYIAGRARVQDYDVNLVVQGAVKPKPDISLSSVPPLPEKDIISLLALGATDTQFNSNIKSGEQGTQTGMQAASGFMKKNPISTEIKERFGVDVQFTSGFDESTAVQKVIISRQFTNRFSLSASQSIGKARGTDAEARYRFNERFSAIGSFQSRESTDTTDKTRPPGDLNTLGLDLEYKFEFK